MEPKVNPIHLKTKLQESCSGWIWPGQVCVGQINDLKNKKKYLENYCHEGPLDFGYLLGCALCCTNRQVPLPFIYLGFGIAVAFTMNQFVIILLIHNCSINFKLQSSQ